MRQILQYSKFYNFYRYSLCHKLIKTLLLFFFRSYTQREYQTVDHMECHLHNDRFRGLYHNERACPKLGKNIFGRVCFGRCLWLAANHAASQGQLKLVLELTKVAWLRAIYF